jgi:ABC-type Mn2+/Zn2+ transport system ATPase subunit
MSGPPDAGYSPRQNELGLSAVVAARSAPRVPAASSGRLLTCEDLVVGYRGQPLLPPVRMSVSRGSFIVVAGRNGSGKSTWFKTLLGLVPPVSGRVVRAYPGLRCTYVPQTSSLDPVLPLKAREMVLWGRLTGWSFLRPFASRRERAAADAALEVAGARAFADRPLRELSEGQKQRVLLARVLASEAQLVLLDEPTSAMDAVAERETMERLAQLARERGLAVVVVTHQLGVVAEQADRVLFLDRESPAVVEGEPRAVLCHPAFRRQYGDDFCARLGALAPGEGT